MIKCRNPHFAIPDEAVGVGHDQRLLIFLGQKVLGGNFKMDESGEHH